MILVAAAMAFCFAAAPSFAADGEIIYRDSEKKVAADLRKHMEQRDSKIIVGIKTEAEKTKKADRARDQQGHKAQR